MSGYAYSVVFEEGDMDGEAFVNIAFAVMISLNPTYYECRITDLYC